MPTHPPDRAADNEPTQLTRAFSDLRRHNEYASRVARMLNAKRQRRVEQVIRAQRKHRLHQAR